MIKHIVNIVPAFVPGDGIGNSARARARGLLDRGYRVTVICATAKVKIGEFTDENGRFELLVAGAGWEAERSSLTTEMIAAVRSADLIFVEFGCFNICHELIQNVAAPLILFYQGITPAVLMQNDMYAACYWRAIGELRKIPQPAMVLAASHFTLDEYSRNTGDVSPKSRVVPLFGNTKESSASQVTSSRRPFRILTVGQLFPHKNYEVLIEATKLLVRDGLDIEVQHIGGANDLIALGYRNKLQSLATSLGDSFKFLGRVDQSVLDKAYADAHVVVIPSLHEGYSLPAREALVHGKPVIASSFGALPETLQNAGKFFHPLDAVELARVIAEYAAMGDPEWTHACNRAKTAAAGHSVERYVQSCVDAIEEVLANRAPISSVFDASVDCSQPMTRHECLEDSDDFISGRITFSPDPLVAVASLSMEALIASSRHVLRTRLGVRTSWQKQLGHAVCLYELPLVGIEDCTSIYLSFVNSETGDRAWSLGGFQRERRPAGDEDQASQELWRLSLAIEDNYGPKSIVAADGRMLTKLKTRVANTILKLVYHVFIGPQMATMQSQMRLLATAIDEIKDARKIVESPESASASGGLTRRQ